eukprot:Lankesteria_metandrocarpae@DN5243_c0_g1_i5.p1
MGKSAAFRSKSGGRVNGRTAFSSKSDSSSTQLNPATPCSTNDNNTSLSSLPSVSSQSIQEHTTSPSNSTRLTTVAAVPSGSNHSASPANTPGGSNGFVQSRNPDRWIAPKTKEWNVDRQKERGKKANRNELWMENED